MKKTIITIILLWTCAFMYSQTTKFYTLLSDTTKMTKMYVTSVHDGDTYRGYFANDTTKTSLLVRLASIDAPELTSPWQSKLQPYAVESGRYLRFMIKNTYVWLDTLSVIFPRDKYGRIVGDLYQVHNGSLLYINKILIESGNAWYSGYPRKKKHTHNNALSRSMNTARKAKNGMWVNSNNIEPSLWRGQ